MQAIMNGLMTMTEHADTQYKEWKSDSVRFFFPCSQSCPTLWDPMDCSLPSSFVHRIFQARIPKLPFPTLGNLPDPGIQTTSPALAGRFFTRAPPRNHLETVKKQTKKKNPKSMNNNSVV